MSPLSLLIEDPLTKPFAGRALACVALLLGSSIIAAATPAGAAEIVPTVQIRSPAANATVSGMLTVELLATHDDATGVTGVTVELNGIRSVRVPVPSSGCSTGCPVTATFDTLTPVGYPSSNSYVLPDGKGWLIARTGAPGVNGDDDFRDVFIDNHRPRLVVDPPPDNGSWPTGTSYPYSADRSLDVGVQATPSPGSSSAVVSVDWAAFRDDVPQPFAKSSSEPSRWAISVPTAQVAEGPRYGYLTAKDDRGVVSVPASVHYMVIHGFVLTPPVFPNPVLDDDLNRVEFGYSYAGAFKDTYAGVAITLVDGVETDRVVQCCVLTLKSGIVTADAGMRVPPGDHVISYIVLDNRGNSERIDVPVTVEQTFFADFTRGAAGRVVAGSPLQMSAELRSTKAPLSGWYTVVDGVQEGNHWSCTGACPMSLSATWNFSHLKPGTHKVEVVASTAQSWPRRISTTVTVQPYIPADPLIGPGNWTGQAGNDLLSRRPNGVLWLQQGMADGSLDNGWQVGSGWGSFTAIVGPGDWNGDQRVDLIARDAAGRLWLYPTNGTGRFLARRQVGTGWSDLNIVAPGDWNGDRKRDLLARDGVGRLWLFPGNGLGGFLARRQIGSGWSGFTALVTPGDWNGDRRTDLVARDGGGRLWLYPGNGLGGFLARRQIGSGWSGFNAMVGPGDMNTDGRADLYARDSAGTTWLYPGNGTGGFMIRRVASRNWY